MSDRQASTFRKGITDYESILMNALSKAKIPYVWQKEVQVGEDKFLFPDLRVPITPGFNLGIEVMGEGSNSDSSARHEALLAHGVFPLYFSNQPVKHSPELCVRQIRQVRAILRGLLP